MNLCDLGGASPYSYRIFVVDNVPQLNRDGPLKLSDIKYFVLDECDKMLEKLDMRADIQNMLMKLEQIALPVQQRDLKFCSMQEVSSQSRRLD